MHSPETSPEFEALLDYLKHKRGCDLTGYKRSTLERRFQYRMENIEVYTYENYLQYLQNHPEEYLSLLDDVLINVTSFFRDQESWHYLATEILPKIVASKQPNEPIRIWSAGCAAGQEIYSALILLAEEIGIEACLRRVRCFATDADDAALAQARQGIYRAQEVASISPELLKKYFEPTRVGYLFCRELRSTIVFSHHDLTRNAPISKIDLLICRNVLIYFNPEVQASVLVRFHFALRNMGFLFLGKAEMLVHHRQILTPISVKHRVYSKGLKLQIEDYLSIYPKSFRQQPAEPSAEHHSFWQTAFEASPVAHCVVDIHGFMIAANEQANRLFGLTLNDLNQPFWELQPGKLLINSCILINKLHRNFQPVTLRNICWRTLHFNKNFDITIAPVLAQKRLLGLALTYVDTTDYQQLTEKLEHTNATLEIVSGTLDATRSELEAAQQEIQLLTQEIQNRDRVAGCIETQKEVEGMWRQSPPLSEDPMS